MCSQNILWDISLSVKKSILNDSIRWFLYNDRETFFENGECNVY